MTTAADSLQIVPESPPSAPALRAADQGVADALESVLWAPPKIPGASTAPSGDSLPTGATRWTCVPCRPIHSPSPATWPPVPILAPASQRCAWPPARTCCIVEIFAAHEWAGHESPGRDPGVREALKGWGRQLAKPQRQAGALTADVLAVIRLTAVQPRQRGRGFETAGQAEERGRFDNTTSPWWRCPTPD